MDELFKSVKNYLDITWDMNTGEIEKLSGIIKRGKAFLEGKIGACDFSQETPEKDLLLNYCMYARAGQIDEFINNYRQEIIALQMNRWRKKKEGETSAET